MTKKLKSIQIGTEETIRFISTEILMILIPIVGIKILNLNNSSIGIATSLSSIGYLLFGYLAGLIADKWDRQYIITSSLLIKSFVFGLFSYCILSSTLTKVSYFSIIILISLSLVLVENTITVWIPDIYKNNELSGINVLIQFSRSTANLIGPALGGFCIGIIGVPYTLFLISIGLIISSLAIIAVKSPKKNYSLNKNKNITNKKNIGIENIKYIFKNPVLRSLILTTGTINFSISMYTAVNVIFLMKGLKLSVSLTGVIISFGGIGAILGSLIAPKLIKKFGVLKTMIFGPIIPSFGLLLVSFAHGKIGIFIFAIGTLCFFTSRSIGSIARVTIQQMILPSKIRGEVSGTMMMLTWGAIPIGAIFAGMLSDVIGVNNVLTIAGIFLILSNIWMLNRKILNLKNKQHLDKIVAFET